LSVSSPQRAKKFARGGLCPRAAKTESSSWGRQQGFKIQSVPAPRTAFHLPAMRARRVRRVDRDSLLPFNKQYPAPGGGRRTIRLHFIAALGQRPPRAGRTLFGCGRQAGLGVSLLSGVLLRPAMLPRFIEMIHSSVLWLSLFFAIKLLQPLNHPCNQIIFLRFPSYQPGRKRLFLSVHRLNPSH